MVWFLVALVLLLAALILFWLDVRGRRGATGSASPAVPVTRDDEPIEQPHEGPEPVGASEQPEAEPASEPVEPIEPAAEPAEPAEHEEPAEPAESVRPADPVAPEESSTAARPAPAKLSDRVRRLLPRRGPDRSRSTVAGPRSEPVDPLAGSPVVGWLETREFAPTQAPAPDFRHGDFACGLPALGTVSHGMFRGRRAIMGVAGGRAVLALQRDTASDVVLDLSRPDVDVEPGFHDAGEVAELEARTSDVGRLELVDRDRLAEAVRGLPANVRRVWAESEWVAATVDDAEDPATWDDTVLTLYDTADALAPLPPVGGRARPLPGEIDPGAPGAAAGPDADPAGGVPDPAGHRPPPAAAPSGDDEVEAEAVDTGPVVVEADPATEEEAEAATTPAEPRRSGHLRLVPERPAGMRDLTDQPVVADRGDTAEPEQAAADADADAADPAEPEEQEEPDEAEGPVEPDPFDQVMDLTGPVSSRGDVAADHLETRPPLSRPSRGSVHSYPEDASVPPLASGANEGESGIKPLGSDDDEDDIRSEVERFDAARIDGGSDLETESTGRHGSPVGDAESPEDTGRLSVADLAAKVGAAPSSGRRRRRLESGDDADTEIADADGSNESGDGGRERPGAEPDVERTMRIQRPKGSVDPGS